MRIPLLNPLRKQMFFSYQRTRCTVGSRSVGIVPYGGCVWDRAISLMEDKYWKEKTKK